MKTTKQYSIILETDQYAGNIERALSGFIFGSADEHGRHRAVDTMRQWSEQVSPKDKGLIDDVIDHRPHDEYGLMPYQICHIPGAKEVCSGVEFYIANDMEEDHFLDVIDYIKRRTKNPIVYKEFPGSEMENIVTINILNIQLKTDTITTEIKDI